MQEILTATDAAGDAPGPARAAAGQRGPLAATRGEAMLAALPGLGSILLLMALIFYVSAVMATKLYADVLPGKFGTLGDSLFTLFQLMTMEGWVDDIVKPAMEHQPWAWLFFLPFIVVSTFIVLNLFIGVIVESIQRLRAERESADARAAQAAIDAGAAEAHADARALLGEIRALREEVAVLRAAGRGRTSSPPSASPDGTDM